MHLATTTPVALRVLLSALFGVSFLGCCQEAQPDMGPRQLASEPIAYTTLKLAKVVGFSAGSTMMGNFGQGIALGLWSCGSGSG